ncbi:MAG: methylmalonyl-CoA mutase [Candidatus Latescibacteria bacterium]|nr:methylmalonyl-CoA mutase [Candidatus Latescibacterota bacterium]
MATGRRDWETAYGGQKERKERFRATSGDLPPLFSPEDLAGLDPERDVGYPGSPPFVRGIQPTMYRGRLWTMRQYAGFGTADETNRRFRYLLDQGQTGLSVAFDLPTQMGYDTTDGIAQGEAGKVGVAIDTLADMERLFDGIPLERVTTSMTINATAGILLLMLEAVAEKQGADPARLGGTIQNDILKEYEARGTFIFPPDPSLRLVTDSFEYCARALPRWNPISISGYHIREAGSTAVQELAFTFANARAYVGAAVTRGLPVDSFAPRLSFFFNAHNHLFEEAAKFRAARRIWERIMREEFGAENPKSRALRFHTQTAGSSLQAKQVDLNIVRTAVQAIAAILGGTQSLHTNGRDEALSLPTEDSARIALRTQQLLAEESGLPDVIDPLGGSWYVESLTNRIEKETRALIEKIDALGGILKAIESGFVQQEIHRSAFEHQKAVERGEVGIVGVNRYVTEEAVRPALFRANPKIVEEQSRRIEEVRAARDAAGVEGALADLEDAARGTDNLFPPLRACIRAYATIGEMCDRLRTVFGTYRDPGLL